MFFYTHRNKIVFSFFFGRKLKGDRIREIINITVLFRFYIGYYKFCSYFLSKQFEVSMFIQLKLRVSQALIRVWKEMQIPLKKKNWSGGASLVAQWLRICLLMQGTRVPALAWEDPTCRRATRPVSHNYWACAFGACAPQRKATIVRPAHRDEEWPPLAAARGSPCTETKTQHSQK